MTRDARHDPPDHRRRRQAGFFGFLAVCIGLVAMDLVVHRHVAHPWEGWFGFYGFYGFVACVSLVLLARGMRQLVMRREDYYDDA